jgi:hypothetical protein
MRSPAFMLCFILLLVCSDLPVYSQTYFCGNEFENIEPDVSNTPPCFDVDYVAEKCIPVYVRINLHFFVDESCDGKIQQVNRNQSSIYKIAEEMIEAANHSFAHNDAQWQVSDPVIPCVPIRLLLKGIYTHCKTNAIGIYNTLYLQQQFGINTDSEINFYIASSSDGSTGIGYHNNRCGSAVVFNKETWWSIGNFVHELGHILTLKHSFERFDGCDDTPVILHNWDKNCNGIIESQAHPKYNEQDLTCWNKLEPGKKPGDDGYSDGNSNGVHDCDEQPPCTDSPCCKMEFQDNNIMSYSAAKSAITTCQLRRMLKDLSGFNCSLIEQIDGCPPANAFITQNPEDLKNKSDCHECLILEASVNESWYELKIYENENGVYKLVYQSGTTQGKAINFCYRTGEAFAGMPNYLKPSTEYKAVLTTGNECSESSTVYHFITNNPGCNNVSYETLEIYPNPGTDLINVEFSSTASTESLQAYVKNIVNGKYYTMFPEKRSSNEENTLQMNINSLPQGNYSLYILNGNKLFQNNFVKL